MCSRCSFSTCLYVLSVFYLCTLFRSKHKATLSDTGALATGMINLQSPQLLEMVHQKLHGIRYRLDHFVINQTQRYYSDNHNPRIIQTKLQDQTLLSLRTCPHDQYLTKKDEYLTLEEPYKTEYRAENKSDQKDIDSAKAGDFIFKGFDDSYLQPFKRRFDFFKPQTQSEDGSPKKCSCGCHPDDPDIIDMSSIVSPRKRLRKLWHREKENIDAVEEKEKDKEKDPDQDEHKDKDKNDDSDKKNGIWKTVLNDISLSAARVSTGDVPKSSHHFQNLSSDFIDAKSSDNDVFAANLQQAKLKYISPAKYDAIKMGPVPSEILLPPSYDSFLDLYNFPTMKSIGLLQE